MIFNLILFFLAGFFKDHTILKSIYLSCQRKLKHRYHLEIEFKNLKINRFTSIICHDLRCCDLARGVLFSAEELNVSINLKHFRSIRKVASIVLKGGDVSMFPTIVNGSSAERKGGESEYNNKLRHTYRKILRSSKSVFKYLPESIVVDRVNVFLNRAKDQRFFIDDFCLKNQTFTLNAALLTKDGVKPIVAEGTLIRTDALASISGDFILDCSAFDAGKATFKFNIDSSERSKEVISISYETSELQLFRGSTNPTKLHYLCFDLKFVINHEGLTLVKSSFAKLDTLKFRIGFHHSFITDKSIAFTITLEKSSAKDLSTSYPVFFYSDLNTADFSGTFEFDASMKISLLAPFKHEFRLKVANNLAMVNPGTLKLNQIKKGFRHSVYENNEFIRDIEVDQESHSFFGFEDMPAHLRNVIVFSEDRTFFEHKGFDSHAIGFAIKINLATRKFSRGASTISMQLVRNLFLNKGKSINRKLEELVLTWLVEDVFAVSKERILEIYLNIIEFGPNIYGIGEACMFYFSKKPSEMTLTESLVLSYAIPRPKFFFKALQQGSVLLLENLEKHMEYVSSEMQKKGIISPLDFQNISNEIHFSSGMGRINLSKKMENFHPLVAEVFHKASERWQNQYPGFPKPSICRNHRPPHSLSLQSFASLAFNICFIDEHGKADSSVILFTKFSDLMKKESAKTKVHWGGDNEMALDTSYYELEV